MKNVVSVYLDSANIEMKEDGAEIQFRASKLFSAFFSKQLLSTEIVKYQDEADDTSTVASVLTVLQCDSEKFKTPFKLYATQFAIQTMDSLIDSKHLSINSKHIVYSVISKLVSRGELNIPEIQAKINNYPVSVPPGVIVELDKAGAISFINYFQTCAECPEKTTLLVEFLFNLACNSTEEHNLAQFHYLFTAIVQIGFGVLTLDIQKHISGQTVKVAVLLINSLTRKLWDFMLKFPEKEIHVFEIQNNNFQQSIHVHLLSFQKCYLDQLVYLISYKPEVRASTALNSQHEWTFFKSPKNIVSFLTQLFVPLEVEKVIDKVDEIINRYEINWKTLLLVVSTVQVCYPKGNRILKALINNLVHRALDNSQKELLLASFLLARQINAENTSSPQYGAWFSSSITSSSTTSKHFAFLLKFLTNSVRHEPAWVLLAHKNNPPYIPVMDNCRALWIDYAALVRTRLEDFKLKNPSEQVIEEDITLVREVDAAIAAYEKNGKIPSSVIEAAIFRKPYFVNKFLPILLKPRQIPNPPDIREEFVEELKKSGKLPTAQYETYCAACQQMGKQNSEIESMDWQASDAKPSYQNLMTQIVSCKDYQQCSFLVERFDSLLASLLPPPDSLAIIKFNSDIKETKETNSVAWKIVECWLESLRSPSFVNDQLDGLNRYFLTLCRYPSLVQSIYGLLWLFTHKSIEDDETIHLYAIVMCLLCVNEHLLLPVCQETFQGNFIQLLLSEKHLVISRSEQMLFHLRLLFHTVSEAKRRNQLSRIRLPSSMYVWLARRVSNSGKIRDCQKYLGLTMDGQFLREATKLSLRDWLRFEMAVETDKDVLSWSERSGYLHSVLEMDYQDVTVPEIATEILDSIVIRLNRPTGLADCSKDLIMLLQSILSNTQATSCKINTDAWLTTYWQKLRIEQGSSVDPLLWNLVCCLPPYLLIRNSLGQSIPESSIRALTNLIENDWRNTMTFGSALFPKHITVHIVRALEGLQPMPVIPCLQFAAQIHGLGNAGNRTWKTLENGLRIFHPLMYELALQRIEWSGTAEVDLLVNQLMVLSATVLCIEDSTQESPMFIHELGRDVSQNPDLLLGWKMSSWIGSDCLLPWNKILPTYVLNLLPFVLLKILISWSDMLLRKDLPTALDFLEALISVNNEWLKTTDSFIDCQTGHRNANYPAGKILDIVTLGRLSNEVKKILNEAPTRALKMFQQKPCYHSMESDYQTLIRQRCS